MKPKTYIFGLALLAGIFSLGLAQLFKLRFETGDVYPPYSSLRADPLGTMALCESLGELPGLSVRRDFSAGNQLPEAPDTTYLHLGAEMSEWRELPEEVFKDIEGFVTRGGRLVVTLLPETSRPYLWPLGGPTASPKGSTNAPTGKKTVSPRPGSGKKRVSDQEEPMVSLKLRWGVDYGYQRLSAGGAAMHPSVLATRQSDLPLPEELEWHSVVVFANLPAAWQAIYARGTNPVVIERRFGRGTVVMATDSYYLSNEALLKDRHADLLAWLVGPGKQVVFDEAHFGIVETNGVAALVRKYRLHGLVAGLILLAALFLWRNSVSLVPASASTQQQQYIAGEEAAAGFVSLLRRNVAADKVLDLCFREWTKSLAKSGAHLIARVDQAQSAMETEIARPPRSRDPVGTYRKICSILSLNKPS